MIVGAFFSHTTRGNAVGRRRGAAIAETRRHTENAAKAWVVLTAGVRHRDDDELTNVWGGQAQRTLIPQDGSG